MAGDGRSVRGAIGLLIGLVAIAGVACEKRDHPPVEVLIGPPVSLRPRIPRDGDRFEVQKSSVRLVERAWKDSMNADRVDSSRYSVRERFEDLYRGAAGSPSRRIERRWENGEVSQLDAETVAGLDRWWRLEGFLPEQPVRVGARWHVVPAPPPPSHAGALALDPKALLRSYANGRFTALRETNDGGRRAVLDVQFVYVLTGGVEREFRGTVEFDCGTQVVTAVHLRERAEEGVVWNVRVTIRPAGGD